MNTADAVRSRSVLPLESDIPGDITIREYRSRRPRPARRPRRIVRRRVRTARG